MNYGRSLNRNLGETIKYFRTKQGLTVYGLSEKTGISQSYIRQLEKNNRKNPSILIVEKLAFALDIAVNEILEVIDFKRDNDLK